VDSVWQNNRDSTINGGLTANFTPWRGGNIECLMAHDWPGNVRELRNRLEYGAIITNGELIQPEHLRLQRDSCQESPISDRMTLCFDFDQDQFSYDAVIRRLVDWAMEKSNDNKSAAARLLKTSRKLFY
jgi:two-component system, NtrC family, response regulator AtoC